MLHLPADRVVKPCLPDPFRAIPPGIRMARLRTAVASGSRHRSLLLPWRAAAAILFTCLFAPAAVVALESDRHQPMDIAADNSDSDLSTGVHQLIGKVEIRQGSLLIQAERGEVHQSGNNQEVNRVVLEGTPARMEQALDNAGGHMRARARRIDYDRAGDTVVLTGGVRIDDPRGTLTGERVIYNIAQGRIQGQGGGGEDGRVRFVIPPPARTSGGDTP